MEDTPTGLTVVTNTDVFFLNGRPCELSAFSHIPANHMNIPRERNYFNSTGKDHYPGSRYDRLFHKDNGYNNKLHRDDRDHTKSRGLRVNDEEIQKEVPTLSSSIYGKKLNLHVDKPDRKHVRIGHVKSEFYRRNGVPISSLEV
ncbi:cilia- and flagella-associated protein 90-like [Physella acuta]|uniref:cilia- and flagella-associated protein 90-like n=1 Tax=Physella acuta TaxID=109671 RepID=UPI0027DBE08E|nr:cilia- and flagella-associated protein 90-like [Physella acuta]